MTSSDELRDAIARLYDSFASYKLAPHVDGCPHCTSDADHASIHAAPLRQLTADHLSRYAFKAMTTWGNAKDFRHFLPRIFELLVGGAFEMSVDPETVIGKLGYGTWRKWPGDEQQAIEQFLVAWWRATLADFPAAIAADSVLCSIGQALDNLEPYLAAWDVEGSRHGACHFAEFVNRNTGGDLRKGKPWKLANAWWRGRPVPAEQVSAWLLQPERMEELERAFFTFGKSEDEVATELLSEAFNHLGSIHLAAKIKDPEAAT